MSLALVSRSIQFTTLAQDARSHMAQVFEMALRAVS